MKDKNNTAAAQALDKLRESEYGAAQTLFLSPGEQNEVYSALVQRGGAECCFFWGGCVGCERRVAVFLPEWYMPENAPEHKMPLESEREKFFAGYLMKNSELANEIQISALRVKGSGFRSLSHRDFMGGILSLGIDRSVLGDIVTLSEREALVMVSDKIREYLISELKKIGRDGVRAEPAEISPDCSLPREFEDIDATLASMRLDSVVKALSGKSRESSAQLIREGLVELNYKSGSEVSDAVHEGDVISVRGVGKFVVGESMGMTKSGRIKIRLKKYD